MSRRVRLTQPTDQAVLILPERVITIEGKKSADDPTKIISDLYVEMNDYTRMVTVMEHPDEVYRRIKEISEIRS